MAAEKLRFASDYMEGAHEKILDRLIETNYLKTPGYGSDEFTQEAKQKILAACGLADGEVHLLVGGTQTNATVIDALLRSYQGVIAAASGHISVHEAGAIEFGGHKVFALPERDGKISAGTVEACLHEYHRDANRDHMVMPGMVYISQPTEYGTLYSLGEMEALSAVCRKYAVPLYVDGARLAYALGCGQNDVTLRDLARLADVFYIGGTKCGALFGEAVVFTKKGMCPHFFTVVKQHGALLAKGRLLGLQFGVLFTDGLYEELGKSAVALADELRHALVQKGYELTFPSPTNQVFFTVDDEKIAKLMEKVEPDLWGKPDDTHTIARLTTSWATTREQVEALINCL